MLRVHPETSVRALSREGALAVDKKGVGMVKHYLSRIALGVVAFAFLGFQPAGAACQLIHATHSARSHAKAVETSRMLALQSARDLQRSRGWSHISMTAHAVPGEPFWKAVRPKGVPAHARLSPDLVTPQFYTTCFTGVVVPLRLHYGFERLRPITVVEAVTALSRR